MFILAIIANDLYFNAETLHAMPVPHYFDDNYEQLGNYIKDECARHKAAGVKEPTLHTLDFKSESANTQMMFVDFVEDKEASGKINCLNRFRLGLDANITGNNEPH